MKAIMPTVITILGIAILTLTASCLITFQMQLTAARNFHTGCISRIQASYYNERTIEDCKTQAAGRGYTLAVQDMTVYDDRKDVLVTLDYTATMPFFNIERDASLEGFAR